MMKSVSHETPSRQLEFASRIKRIIPVAGLIATVAAMTPIYTASGEETPPPEPTAVASDGEQPEFMKKDSDKCSWITEKPSGHYFGYACSSDDFVKLHNSESGNYDYGVVFRNGRQICGWVEAGILNYRKRTERHQTCMDIFRDRDDRYSVGKRFNCGEKDGESKCVDGRETELKADCDHSFYRNFASSKQSHSNLEPDNNSGFYDYIGKETGTVRYRYTKKFASKKDGIAAIVRSDTFGWGVISRDCIDGTPRGGPKKHEDAVAGPRPNSGR